MNNSALCGAMGVACPTPTKQDLADWFSGLAIHLSTMYKKEEQEENE